MTPWSTNHKGELSLVIFHTNIKYFSLVVTGIPGRSQYPRLTLLGPLHHHQQTNKISLSLSTGASVCTGVPCPPCRGGMWFHQGPTYVTHFHIATSQYSSYLTDKTPMVSTGTKIKMSHFCKPKHFLFRF